MLTITQKQVVTRNYTIDIFRILGAFCVVALHSPLGSLPNSLALSVRLCSRWAVPFFFLVSGYFAARNLRDRQSINFSKSINYLVAIFIASNIVYCLFYAIDNNAATTIKLTFVGLLVGQTGHLWYIGSNIFGLLILQLLVSRYSDKVLVVVALIVFLGILVGDGYSRLTGITLQYEVARYLTSIPFLFAGFLIARHGEFLQYLSVKLCLISILVGLLVEYTEAYLLYTRVGAGPHNQELLIGTALLALGLFCLSLVFITPSANTLSDAGKNYSLVIYLYHPLVITLLYSVIKIGQFSAYVYWVSPFIDFVVTLLLIKAIEKTSPTVFRLLSGG
ncbi:acyltransferase family protein [Hymenobacter sp. HMF4947]|uniref:Acyltransferase family protein n=1 Tax=Hymenobacter ginkgonis TaxID=2682976 RepID=A0A7K1TKL9_9BACT|nr:acyltransferase [Hymenobacter ginkgonis]MVN78960.1 acyltransferase family protein [Hymenobacter ginkgonis]